MIMRSTCRGRKDPKATTTLIFIVGFLLVIPASCSHFRGALITWRPVNPESDRFDGRIEITHRLAWRRSAVGLFCDGNTISQHTFLDGGGSLVCRSGCSGVLGGMGFYCTHFSDSEDWTAGQRSYIANLFTNVTTFEASFSGESFWFPLQTTHTSWEVRIKGDLRVRDDTGRINTPPVTDIPPIVRLQYDHPDALIIPVEDADGDVVHCRWANSSLNECGGVCYPFPFGELHEEGCALEYNGHGALDGWYVIAVQIEDFATHNSTTPLSSVPLQFLIHTFNETIPHPIFVGSTLGYGARIRGSHTSHFITRIVAESGSNSTTITAIHTVSPPGIRKSELMHVQDTRQWWIDVHWTPLSAVMNQFFCFQAFDSEFQPSDIRCIVLIPPTGEFSLLWLCKRNILLGWRLPESVRNKVEEFKLTYYINNRHRDIHINSITLGAKKRWYNFAKRPPNKRYRFKLEMKLQGERILYEIGSLVVGRTCPGGEECCSDQY